MLKFNTVLQMTLAVFVMLMSVNVWASDLAGPYRSNFLGKAAEGYDVVAYFSQGKAVEGDGDFTYEWKDSEWRFASAENRAKFEADPAKYAPQYGGYCAYAVSQGYTASVDPEAWSIVDGKLYLNYSKSVQSTWTQDIPGYIASADGYWPKVREGL